MIRQVNPDIVHTHGSLSGRIAGRRCGKTVIYTRHSVFPPGRLLRTGPGRLLNKLVNEHYADRIIAVSQAAKDNLTEGGIRPGLIDVILNGVEPVPRFKEAERRLLRARTASSTRTSPAVSSPASSPTRAMRQFWKPRSC